MASASAVGSGKRVSTASSGGVPAGAKARSSVEAEAAPLRGEAARGEVRAERHGEPAEDEPDRLQLGDGGLDRQAEDEPLRRAAGPEGLDLLATGARPDAGPFLAESRHQRRRGQLRHLADPAKAEPAQPGADRPRRG